MPVTIGGSLSFCGRELQPQELDLIRQITRDFSTLSLTELAPAVCELLEWRRPNGGLKGRECFLFLQALHQGSHPRWCKACKNRKHSRPFRPPFGRRHSSSSQTVCASSVRLSVEKSRVICRIRSSSCGCN